MRPSDCHRGRHQNPQRRTIYEDMRTVRGLNGGWPFEKGLTEQEGRANPNIWLRPHMGRCLPLAGGQVVMGAEHL